MRSVLVEAGSLIALVDEDDALQVVMLALLYGASDRLFTAWQVVRSH